MLQLSAFRVQTFTTCSTPTQSKQLLFRNLFRDKPSHKLSCQQVQAADKTGPVAHVKQISALSHHLKGVVLPHPQEMQKAGPPEIGNLHKGSTCNSLKGQEQLACTVMLSASGL